MKKMVLKRWMLVAFFACCINCCFGQKGSLFIIGGGERGQQLMEELMKTAQLSPNDYIVVLTMATSVPGESFESIHSQLAGLSKSFITGFNFTRDDADNKEIWIDSVQHAKMIYIVGGDQNRFMDVVRGTKLYHAMHDAYEKGATISGTSAGAAVMSQIMITGEEKDKNDKGNFRQIRKDNVDTSEGMGFITGAIVDQHFIKRSRYNRLLSALADHPDKMVIGIDESTAIVVKGKDVRVVGESQVVVISKPRKIKISADNKVAFKDAQLSLFVAGDSFKIK